MNTVNRELPLPEIKSNYNQNSAMKLVTGRATFITTAHTNLCVYPIVSFCSGYQRVHLRKLPRMLQPQDVLHHPLFLWSASTMQVTHGGAPLYNKSLLLLPFRVLTTCKVRQFKINQPDTSPPPPPPPPPPLSLSLSLSLCVDPTSLDQGARRVGVRKGEAERSGELPPGGHPGGAGGRAAPAGEASAPLLHRSPQHLQKPWYTPLLFFT